MCKLTLIAVLVSAFLTLTFKLHQDGVIRLSMSSRAPASIQSSLEPRYSILRATVFAKCIGCHSNSGYGPHDFGSYHSLLSSGKVVPGSAQKSDVYRETASMRMPLHQAPLSSGELEALRQWIDSGALNN